MKIDLLRVTPLYVNCVMLSDNSKNLIIIDPGGDVDKIIQYTEEGGFKPLMILLTHGHFDHIGAVQNLRVKYNTPVSIHKSDELLLKTGPDTARYFGFDDFTDITVDNYLNDNQEISAGGIVIKVIHTPGHTMGCVCFYLPEINTVFTGDTLFKEGVGRTDFYESDQSALVDSIRLKLYSLNDDTVVYPGHGHITSIGYERLQNPYIRDNS
ncbi:MAG: MBL fold metallo-hydrolase [Deferribacteraceae bacterium]|jgi:glyoxylase-like metal-dependent hydrolase (beta-lactamase superfamily II)|nr:MBL fold metallo-hydrolase [Deferribacteraceae bacterium]